MRYSADMPKKPRPIQDTAADVTDRVGAISGDVVRTVAYNLRRHMAREGLKFEDIITATELDDRTIRGVAASSTYCATPGDSGGAPR